MPITKDPSKLKSDHIMSFNGKQYWVDAWLQSEFYKPDPLEIKWSNEKTERKTPTGSGADARKQCMQTGDKEEWGQKWGHYWIDIYVLEKRRSYWFYAGIALAVVGVVIVIAVTAGAAAGPIAAVAATATTAAVPAAATTFVTAAGTMSALGTASLAGGGALIGIGGATTGFNKEKDQDQQGASAGPSFPYDVPIDAMPGLIKTTPGQVERDWHDCAPGE